MLGRRISKTNRLKTRSLIRTIKTAQVTINLFRGEITDECQDALVNSTNSHLILSSYLARKAGRSVVIQTTDQIMQNGPLKPGEVFVGDGGNLHSRQVIHACVPI